MPETSTSLGAPESQVTEVENAQIDTQMFQALVNNTDEIEGLLENIDGNTDGIEGLLADILVVLEDCCGDDNGNNNYVPPEPCLECDWNPTGLGDDSLDGPGTDTASWIGQSNFLIDEDYVGPNGSAGNGPEVVNFNSANQSVTADGGFADADDGIGDVDFSTDGTGEYHVGDDYSMVGSASASADGVADGDLVTQDLATGANGQLTDFGIDIVGADANNFDVGGDNEFGLLASDGLAMTETDTETYVYQANLMGDTDDVIDAQVLNAGDGSATQSVSASGGEGAFAEDGIDAFVEGTEAVDADPVPGVVSAGDNVTIDGSTSGSADALAFGELLTQEIDTGLNGQQNQVLASIVGGDQNSISAGDDQDLMGEITVSGDDSADTNSLFMVDQFNELEDSDLVDNASVANNGIANQSVTANGGLASAQDGFDAKTAELEIEAGDSVFVAGSASASADATAVGDMLSQDITTGGNGQSNLTSASIVGGDQNLASVGDDQSLIGEFGFGGDDQADTDSMFSVAQGNFAYDFDLVDDASVVNNSEATQNVAAFGVSADADEGIDGGSGSDDDNLADLTVSAGDDVVIAGSASASADATAGAELATQEITTGGNTQTNVTSASIVGIDDNSFSVGEDNVLGPLGDLEPIEMDFPELDSDGTDQAFCIHQVNDLVDADVVNDPYVHNNGFVGQTVSATGGFAEASDGIGEFGEITGADIGDDMSIFGSTSASADALAIGDLLTQNITMGANFQGDSVQVSVVGGTSTELLVGEDNELAL